MIRCKMLQRERLLVRCSACSAEDGVWSEDMSETNFRCRLLEVGWVSVSNVTLCPGCASVVVENSGVCTK